MVTSFLTLIIIFILCIPYIVFKAADNVNDTLKEKRQEKRVQDWKTLVVDSQLESEIRVKDMRDFQYFQEYQDYRQKYVDGPMKAAFEQVREEIRRKHPDYMPYGTVEFEQEDYERILLARKGKLRSVDSGWFGISGGLNTYKREFVEWIDGKLQEHGINAGLCYRTAGPQWGGGTYAKSAWNRVPSIWQKDGTFLWEPAVYETETIIR